MSEAEAGRLQFQTHSGPLCDLARFHPTVKFKKGDSRVEMQLCVMTLGPVLSN